MQDAFLKAIEENDLAALKVLVQQHGTAVELTFRKSEEMMPEEFCQVRLRGEPLNIAVYLRREELAIFLLEQGAVPKSASYSSEHCGDWSQHEVTPMESATSFEMKALTKALMEGPHLFNWAETPCVDRSDWGGSSENVSIFQQLLTRKDVMQFMGEVGIFRGMVAGRLVEVKRRDHDFAIFMDGAIEHIEQSMEASLRWVWDKLGLVKERSPYDDDLAILARMLAKTPENAAHRAEVRAAQEALAVVDDPDEIPF